MENMVLMTDSYKVSHHFQYPPGTTNVYSYFESRSGGKFKETCFFGLQYLLKKYFTKPVTMEDIKDAYVMYANHFGTESLFNLAGWTRIVTEHGGYLPVEIKAIPEGTVTPVSNVLLTIENTDPELPWLTNWLETLLSQLWYPTTVATVSREAKKTIHDSLVKTGDPGLIDFKLHDFGFRGVSSVESAEIGGLAHLVNFMGSDTVAAIYAAQKYYGENMAAFAIPAAEHSTITSWGKENEAAAYKNMIEQFGEYPLYAVVSDSYDIYGACADIWGKELKDDVLNASGTLVVRPDSGYPPMVVTNILKILYGKFGGHINEKGFRVLHPKVRVIQGDGLDYSMIGQICSTIEENGFSTDNIAFGMGAGLLQKVDRDTQKFAFKCSDITINGEHHDVFKDPITDTGKISKKGRLSLVQKNGTYFTDREGENGGDCLVPVFRNGEILVETTLAEVRERAKVQ